MIKKTNMHILKQTKIFNNYQQISKIYYKNLSNFLIAIGLLFLACNQPTTSENIPTTENNSALLKSVLSKDIYYFDFEDISTVENQQAITKEFAFSGENSCKLSKTGDFSAVINFKGKDFLTSKINNISFNIWARTNEPEFQTLFVFSITDSTNNISKHWQGIEIKNHSNNKEWFEFSGTFQSPEINIAPTDNVSFYAWNRKDTTVFIDDVFLNFNLSGKSFRPNRIFLGFEAAEIDVQTGGITNVKAHNGSFSAYISGENSYSPSIRKNLQDFEYQNINSIGISAWICAAQPVLNTTYVVTLEDSISGEMLMWRGKEIAGNNFSPGEWFKISSEFLVEKNALIPSARLNIYFWNRASSGVFIDDMYIVLKQTENNDTINAYCDLTKFSFHDSKQINFPPYLPIEFCKTDFQTNTNFLIYNEITKSGLFSEKALIGNFVGAAEFDEIILPDSNKNAELFAFCEHDKSFHSFNLEKNKLFNKTWQILAAGNVAENITDEIISVQKNELKIFALASVKEQCNNNSDVIYEIQEIASSILSIFPVQVFSLQLIDDKLHEIVVSDAEGNWNILKFSEGKIKVLASGNLSIWNKANYKYIAKTGKFIAAIKNEQILTVFEHKNDTVSSFAMLHFNQQNNSLKSIYTKNATGKGQEIGIEQLRVTDILNVSDFDGDNISEIVRINREFRYDIKLIRFFDESFEVQGNIEFSGYEGNSNPKYFEYPVCKTICWAGNHKNTLIFNLINKTVRSDFKQNICLYQLKNSTLK